MSDRLTDLEIRYTHLERLVDELSKAVFEERLAREKLEEQVKELVQRSRADGLEVPPGDEPPPHY